MDGIELILAVRKMGQQVPIVAVSGGGRLNAESLLADVREIGTVEVVPKPFNLDQIRAVLARRLPLLMSVLGLVG
jgi:DNA-binding response OmpR family regulator